jgi:hypothetical protein
LHHAQKTTLKRPFLAGTIGTAGGRTIAPHAIATRAQVPATAAARGRRQTCGNGHEAPRHDRGKPMTVRARLFAAVLVLNPAVSQTNIHDTICVAGWTKTVRPSPQALRPIEQKLIGRYRGH